MLDAQIALSHSCHIVQPNRFMTNLIRNHLRFIALLAISCNYCFAQPSGEFSLDFDNSTPIIDLNGNFVVFDQIIGADDQTVALNFGVGLTHASNGALRGRDVTLVQIGDADFVAAFYRASGRVSGGGENPVRVFLTVNLRGGGTVAGLDTSFNITVSYNLTFNQETGALEGASRGRAKLSRLGGGKISSDSISVGLPGGGDGSWFVAMNVIPFKTLSGSAQIVLSSGRTLNGSLLGRFFEDSEVSVLRFSGTNVDRGASSTFSFTVVEGVDELETVQGKILGQRVIF
jgi:hypothetical protein